MQRKPLSSAPLAGGAAAGMREGVPSMQPQPQPQVVSSMPLRRETRSAALHRDAPPPSHAEAIKAQAAQALSQRPHSADTHHHQHVATAAAAVQHRPATAAQPLAATAASLTKQPSSSSSAAAAAAAAASRGLQSGAIVHRMPGAPQKGPDGQEVQFLIPEIVSDPSVKRVNSQGITVCKQYRRGRYLGKGGFAVCYELTSLDSHRLYAGKIIPRITLLNRPSAQKKMVHEIKIHRSISHPNVVKFERFFEDDRNVYLLLEICSQHTLMELVKRRGRLTETETQYYMHQLVSTMQYLHSQNIIHRDLKLGNLFLNENLDIRIGDFGLATQLEHADQRKSTLCGTPNYIAPEILQQQGHSFEVDTWAMGVIMYTMLIGRPPFETSTVDSTYERIRHNRYEFPAHIPISPAAKNMISAILAPNAKARPSLAQLLGHPFFTQSPFPKQLPLSCKTTPLEWTHALSNEAAAAATQQENAPAAMQIVITPPQPTAAPAKPPAATAAVAPAPRVALATRTGFNNLPTTGSAVHSEAPKPAAPVAAAPAAPVARVSAARPTTAPASAAAQVAPLLPSAAAAAAVINAKKEVAFAAPVVAPQQQAIAIAVPKRSSGGAVAPPASHGSVTERRVTRRTSGEEARSIIAATPVDDIDAVVTAMHAVAIDSATAAAPAALIEVESAGGAGPADAAEDAEEAGALRKMHDEIERSFCGPSSSATESTVASSASIMARNSAAAAAAPQPPAPLAHATLWVNKWVDYSNKYGLGYLLSNGDSGVYFNDSSKAILHANGERFEYIERKSSASSPGGVAATAAGADSERAIYSLSNYPASLQKKVTLLRHFTSHLVKAPTAAGAEAPQSSAAAVAAPPSPTGSVISTASSVLSTVASPDLSSDGGRVYVKKWLRTKHAIFFRLSNRSVQVIFQDLTELVLQASSSTVTYTDKLRRRETCAMDSGAADGQSSAIQSRPDLAKRMKYTQDILKLLLSKGSAASAPADRQ